MEITKGARFGERFTILEAIRTGGTASIYKAYDDQLRSVIALKLFTLDGRDPEVVNEIWNRETTALQALNHESIVRFLDAGRDSGTNQRFIVLEWIDGMTLEDHLEAVGPVAWTNFYEKLGQPILDALAYAAERNITHRDLSPGNVMVTPMGAIKIIDFGQAKVALSIIGRTVAAWRTQPYCPPEEDNGLHTYTRDPFSFCAIAVRALIGRALTTHDALYDAFASLQVSPHIRAVIARGLSRDPRERYPNTIEFQRAISTSADQREDRDHDLIVVPVRLTPAMNERVIAGIESDEITASELIIEQLNDAVAISPASNDANGGGERIELETQGYRLIADIDSSSSDHLVIVNVVRKRFRLDSLYQADRWIPQARFTAELPRTGLERAKASNSLQALYRGLEEYQAGIAASQRKDGGQALTSWTRLLDALRFLGRTAIPSLYYSSIDADGNRLLVTVENPDDAEEGQIRTISVDRRWVFRGEVESIRGNVCVLVSNRPRINLEAIPNRGLLEMDWQQTKIALDRQARAVDKFKTNAIPNPSVGKYLTGEDRGPADATFAQIPKFFDSSLDPPKKEVVSRCGTGIPLIVTHGPPGTGKTKLIVELVRQQLAAEPSSKVLLVSQTHVALDYALERLLAADPHMPCVRIGSGSADIDPRVTSCTVEERGKALRRDVEASSRKYLEEKAKQLGIDRSLVELGLRALEVLEAAGNAKRLRDRLSDVELESGELTRVLDKDLAADLKTADRSDHQTRITVLEQEVDSLNRLIDQNEAELGTAKDRLGALGRQGRELALLDIGELKAWVEQLMADDRQRNLRDLMKLAELWRLRFGQSEDFTAAIISSSSVVAGTCVGFCREEAASRATFDLCIIDEAGKATTTELLVPLAQARRAVIVGDHHQLPAVLDFAIHTQEFQERFDLTAAQVKIQLFEELTRELHAGALAKLSTQYRMRDPIGSLVSTCFYDGELHTDESLRERAVPSLALAGIERGVTWLDPYIASGATRFEQKSGTSYSSFREIQCIVSSLMRISFVVRAGQQRNRNWPVIGIITGYGAQAQLLRAEIRRNPELDGLAIECSTVHAFQGREVDICIYSVARRNREHRIGMLRDWRHLNVALSRARDYLVIVGSLEFCRNAAEPNPFGRIVKFIETSPECEIRGWSDD